MDEKNKEVSRIYFRFTKEGRPETPIFVLADGREVEMTWTGTGSCWVTDFKFVTPPAVGKTA